MASGLLTAIKIWENFTVTNEITEEIIKEENENGLSFKYFYFTGRKVKEECVKLYACLVSQEGANLTKTPAVIFTPRFCDGMDLTLAKDLASRGYACLILNQGGKKEGEEHGTIYPESISYAYFDKERANSKQVPTTVLDTCYYEWAVNQVYAFEYLSKNLGVKKIGAFAIDEFANSVWQASLVVGYASAVIIGNAGWQGYKEFNKFSTRSENPFNDNDIKFIAGIDAQSYAMHAKCPILMLSPTNSPDYDLDRAYDTLSSMDEEYYSAIYYSLGGRYEINYNGYQNAVIFMEKFLKGKKVNLPSPVTIKSELVDGKIIIEVVAQEEELKKLTLHCSEDVKDSALRSWQLITNLADNKEGKYYFEYRPYKNSNRVMFFVTAKYKNDFRICSNVICRKYENDEINGNHRYRVIYSSKYQDGNKYFTIKAENSTMPSGIQINPEGATVKEEKGPYGIYGAFAEGGLLTFKIGAEKFKPSDDEILMLDAFVDNGGYIEISLITDIFGEKQEYKYRQKTTEGTWQNIKIELNDFKLENGRALKSYANVQAIAFNSENKFLVNNVLWI